MSAPTPVQLASLLRLWEMTGGSHSGARVAARVLLGCYNGMRFPFDLTDLRLLDSSVLSDVLMVLVMDSSPQAEVHELLNRQLGRRDIGMRLELLACDWRLKGKIGKEEEREIRARLASREAVAA